ncbi:MAG: TonB-dependent receptor plug domain-containing protein [Acidobacteriota bacterium]
MTKRLKRAFLIAIIIIACTAAAEHAAAQSDTTRAAIAAPRDTLVRITPFTRVGSLSVTLDRYTSADAASILWNEYRTLSDLVSSIPGVFVSAKSSPGQPERVSFTGAGDAATVVLVDGISLNDPFTGTYNFSLFPVEAVEQLEVVTGARAFLYGDNSAGGAVNVVTKSFSNNKPYTRIRYSQGMDGYTQTDALFSQNIVSRFNLMFGLSYLGYGYDNLSNFYRGRYANAASGAYTFRTKLRYDVSSTLNLVFTHFYHQGETELNGGVDVSKTPAADWYNENEASVVNLEAYEKFSNHHAALSAVYRPTGDSTLSGTLTLFGAHRLREYRDEQNRYGAGNEIFVHENFESGVLGARAQADWAWRGNAFTAIAEAHRTDEVRSLFGRGEQENRQFVSLKDELSPFRAVTLAGYIRIENGQKQMLENFGADVRLRISDVLTASAGASQSHRRPTRAERALAGGIADTTVAKMLKGSDIVPWTSAHAPLEDEVHHVAEASLRFTPHAQFALDLTASRRMIDHFIDNALIIPHQGQNITFDVLTAAVQTHFGSIHIDASAEYTHQSELLRGDPSVPHTMEAGFYGSYAVRLFPEWRGAGSVYFRGTLAKGNLDLKAGMSGRFWSAFHGMQERFPDGVPNPTLRRTIGNAGVLDLFLIAHIGDAQIHVIMENVTNTGYMLAPYYPMYDRGFRFGVSWEFWN